MHLARLFNLTGPDLAIILLIVLLLFGAKKLSPPGSEAEPERKRERPIVLLNRLLIPIAIRIILLA